MTVVDARMAEAGPVRRGLRARLVSHWAMADLRRDWAISGMSVLLLLLLIGPPLFLAVLRAGVIEGWASALQADPRNREVVIVGEQVLSDADIAAIAALPQTGFVVPEPSTFISAIRLSAGGRPVVLDLLTSAPGDPILGDVPAPAGPDEVTLTVSGATQLGVAIGDHVDLTLRRQPRDAAMEVLTLPLTVSGIVPPEVWPGDIAFLHPARAGGATLWMVPGSGRADALATPGEDVWRAMRLYSGEVRQAPALSRALEDRGFDTVVASEQVVRLVRLSDGLRRLMAIAVAGGLAGLSVAVWLLQVLSVARRRREIALMGAAGLGRRDLIGFFVVQGLMLSTAALVLAVLLLLPMGRFTEGFAAQFALQPDVQTRLPIGVIASGAAIVLALTLVAGAAAVWRLRHVDLSADLRAD